jgi:hypothetical protein
MFRGGLRKLIKISVRSSLAMELIRQQPMNQKKTPTLGLLEKYS